MYSSALFIPISSYVERSRKRYYDAYTQVEVNERLSGVLDVTPFLVYFIENVYDHLTAQAAPAKTTEDFKQLLAAGQVTEKERDLWNFVLSAYGSQAFSTIQLEKDFSNAAYATIRKFVLKFRDLGLLAEQKFGSRVKYHVNF